MKAPFQNPDLITIPNGTTKNIERRKQKKKNAFFVSASGKNSARMFHLGK